MHTVQRDSIEENNYKKVILSVMPTFRCRGECFYCYLGSLRYNDTYLDTEKYKKLLDDFTGHGYSASIVQVYGGNIDYPRFDELVEDIRSITINKLGIEPSFISKKHNTDRPIISLNIERNDYKENLEFLHKHPESDVIVCALPMTVNTPVYVFDAMCTANATGNLTFVQYHPSVLCKKNVGYEKENLVYQDFLKDVINYYNTYEPHKKKKYTLTNLVDIQSVIHGTYDNKMSSHLYISPFGTFGCVKYTDEGLEYFKWFDTIEEWEQECRLDRFKMVETCGTCPRAHRCYAEHYRSWKDTDTCCGFPDLVDWVENK